MRRPGLLVQARPVKASSIDARQHSGVGHKNRVHTCLGRHGMQGREFKNKRTAFLSLAIIAASASSSNAKRRRLEGGFIMIKHLKQATQSDIIPN